MKLNSMSMRTVLSATEGFVEEKKGLIIGAVSVLLALRIFIPIDYFKSFIIPKTCKLSHREMPVHVNSL